MMILYLKRVLAWPILIALSISCAPTPQVTPQPDRPSPNPAISTLPQMPVTNLVITSDGAAWYSFGNFDFQPRRGGIVREARGQQTRFRPEAVVQLLKVAPDGSLWAGTGCGLSRFDGQTWQTVSDSCDKLHGNIVDLAFTSDGAVWIAASFKLARYQNDEWTIIDRLIDFVAVTPDGTLWAAGWEGTQGSQYLARFDGTQWTIVERAAIRQLLANSDGSVWGIQNGNSLVRRVGASSHTFTNLPFDQINTLTRGPNGEVWAITDRGVVRFNGNLWQLANNLPGDVTQMAFAPDGSLWLGNRTGAVTRADPSTLQFTTLPARPAATPSGLDPS